MPPAGQMTREQIIKQLVDKFLAWPLPDSVCSDLCATKQGYPHRSGTTLLSSVEAKQMIEYLLDGYDAALRARVEELESYTRDCDVVTPTLKDQEALVEQIDTLQAQLANVENEITRLPAEESLPIAQIVHRDLEQYRSELNDTRQQLAAVTQERDDLVKDVKDRESEIFRLRDLEGVPQCWKTEHMELKQQLLAAQQACERLEAKSESFWLIERGSPAEWWAGNHGPESEWWTSDIYKVHPLLRFPTRQGAEMEAEKLITYCGIAGPLRVVDHMSIKACMNCEALEQELSTLRSAPHAAGTWTTSKPTKAGWYWYRSGGPNTGEIVEAVEVESNGVMRLVIELDYETTSELFHWDGEWSGPIHAPGTEQEGG